MTLPTAAVEREEINQLPQVDRAVTRLAETVERLDQTVSRLVDRLSPVLRPVEESPQLAAARPALVPLADSLHDVANRIDGVQMVAADALDRIEL